MTGLQRYPRPWRVELDDDTDAAYLLAADGARVDLTADDVLDLVARAVNAGGPPG